MGITLQLKTVPDPLPKDKGELVLVKTSLNLRNWSLSERNKLLNSKGSSECYSEEFLFLIQGQSSTVPGVCEYLLVLDQL